MIKKPSFRPHACLSACQAPAAPEKHAGSQFFFAVAGGGNGRSLVLVLTELTGMYCISSVLLIRKQLPIQYR